MVATTVSALAVIIVTAGWEVYACQHPADYGVVRSENDHPVKQLIPDL